MPPFQIFPSPREYRRVPSHAKLSASWEVTDNLRSKCKAFDTDTKVKGWALADCPPPFLEKEVAVLLAPHKTGSAITAAIADAKDKALMEMVRSVWDTSLQAVRAV